MRISRKTDYALRVLFSLIDSHGGEPVPIGEIAARNDIPKRFLEHIVLELKDQGWVESLQGKKGGYRLARSPEGITMGEVVRGLGGPLAPTPCVSVTAHEPCSMAGTCVFKKVMSDLRDHAASLLDQASLADVAAGRSVVPRASGRGE